MKFRYDINGLRAIAVVGVVLFHFNESWMPGGFAGVDVFFVISGYLMTGIIFRGMATDFSIFKFYVARANRIIPALAALCFVILVFGWFYLTPTDYKSLGKHTASSMAFVSNIVYWRESGYFDASSHDKWLLHTWSLSTEWQFYIIYPLVLVTLRKFMTVDRLKLTVLLGSILSFIFCVIATYKWPNPAYYLLPTRAWEMMVGGIAYLYPLSIKNERKKYLEWFSVSLIVGSYLIISKNSPWPGYLAIFPVLGSFLLIQAQRNDSFITGNVVFQKIGAWSYSIYLWHWPIVVVIYYYSLPQLYIYLGMIISVLLGFLSSTYIERIKFRIEFGSVSSYFKSKSVFIGFIVGILGSVIFFGNGLDLNFRDGASTPQAKFLNHYAIAHKNLDEAYWVKCDSYTALNENGSFDIDPSCIEKQGEGGVFLWGDSHAEALSLGLRQLLAPSGIPFYQKTSAGCKASLTPTHLQKGIFKQACDHSNKLAINSIQKLPVELVIIAQRDAHDKTDWDEIHSALINFGVKSVILIGPVPQWQPSLPKVMVKAKNWNSESNYINDIGLQVDFINLDTKMKSRSFKDGFYYISLIDSLCEIKEDRPYCRVKTPEGDLLQVDYGHLSKEGSKFVVSTALAVKTKQLLINKNDDIIVNRKVP